MSGGTKGLSGGLMDDIEFGRPFVLARDVDHSGASGTGVVADGVR